MKSKLLLLILAVALTGLCEARKKVKRKQNTFFDPQSIHIPEIEYISPSRFEELMEQAIAGDVEAQYLVGRSCLEGWPVAQNHSQAFLWLEIAASKYHPKALTCLAALYFQGNIIEQNIKLGIKYTQRAAQRKEAVAAYNLAALYDHGIPSEFNRSPAQATKWYQKSADLNYPAAMYRLGYRQCFREFGITQNVPEGKKLIEKAAMLGYGPACSALGRLISEGKGTNRDAKLAFDWHFLAAAQGIGDSQAALGEFYLKGKGVPVNELKAFHWYRQGAVNGSAEAYFVLAQFYDEGVFVEQDSEQALSYYAKAAKGGKELALVKIAYHLFFGIGMEKDRAEAFFYLDKALESNNPEVKFQLGIYKHQGIIYQKNLQEGTNFILGAARQGHPQALTYFGLCCIQGIGTAQDTKRGISSLRQAIKLNHPQACYQLGKLYQEGRLAQASAQEALKLFQKAADNGYAPAQWAMMEMRFPDTELASKAQVAQQLWQEYAQVEDLPSKDLLEP